MSKSFVNIKFEDCDSKLGIDNLKKDQMLLKVNDDTLHCQALYIRSREFENVCYPDQLVLYAVHDVKSFSIRVVKNLNDCVSNFVSISASNSTNQTIFTKCIPLKCDNTVITFKLENVKNIKETDLVILTIELSKYINNVITIESGD